MKQIKNVLVIFSLCFSCHSFATSHFAMSCPNKFIGTVVSVDDVQASSFPKIEVNFQVIQNIKGDVFESKKIQIVKDGPIEFKAGQTYTVETRDSWLCTASVLTSSL